jgi:serine/threonine-protein kinase
VKVVNHTRVVNHTKTITVREIVTNGTTTRSTVTAEAAQVTVPDVVGMSETDAKATLDGAGLSATSTEVASEEPKGIVTAQDPIAGKTVDKGSTVTLSVSSGPSESGVTLVPVPPVVGESIKRAIVILRRAGFDFERTDVEADQAAGIVVSQDPEGGTRKPPGTTVKLSVSQGPPAAKKASVPDVVGLDSGTAQADIEAAGLVSAVETVGTSDQSRDGIVLKQDPGAGTEVDPGSPVTIFVGQFQNTG